MERSQPLLGRPSQSAKPVAHVVIMQPLLPQAAAATLGSAAQLVPHPPQLAVVLIATSQPSLTVPLQSRKPEAQVNAQVPFVLQPAPDVFGLPMQLLVQLPQVAGCEMLVSQLVLFMSQSRCVDAHVSTKQVPVLHVAVAFAIEQVTPQPPQLPKVRVLVSQPSAMSPLQFAKPVAHVI